MKKERILCVGVLCALLGMFGARQAPAETVADRSNVVIVLDGSGSMGQSMTGTATRRLDAARGALKAVFKQVPMETYIGLLVFSSGTADSPWVYPLGPRDDAVLTAAIDKPQPGGPTPLGAFIKMGADKLLEQRTAQHGYGSFRLLIVTDGEATDPELVDEYFPDVISRGIIVDVIGLDLPTTHTLAARAHSYRAADDPASLQRAIAEVFAELDGAGTDAAGEEAFDEIAPIPGEVAVAMLKALSSSGNEPVGQVKRSAGPLGTPTPRPVPTPASATSTSQDPKPVIMLFAAVVVFIVLFRIVRAARETS